MTAAALTVTDFLLARIAEDEAAARAVGHPGGWRVATDGSGSDRRFEVECDPWPGANRPGIVAREDDGGMPEALCAHIARHEPARVLAECEAKRRIVEMFPAERWPNHAAVNHEVVHIIAAVYADHPDYREEWRP